MFTVKDNRQQRNTFASAPKNWDKYPSGMQSADRSLDSLYLLQRNLGNGYLQAIGDSQTQGHDDQQNFQAKLVVGSAGDVYEQEEEEASIQTKSVSAGSPGKATSCPASEDELRSEVQQERLQRKTSGECELQVAPRLEADFRDLQRSGQPLSKSVRAFFEPRFGYDFSRVRVHSGAAAEQSARHMNASAYTVGHNIVFGAGQYAPGTTEGKRLLAHELTHVVQQRGGMGERLQRAPDGTPTAPVEALEPLEAVAQRIARLAVGPGSRAVNVKIGGQGPVISVVRNIGGSVRRGNIYVGLNTGVPAKPTEFIKKGIEAQKQRIKAGEVRVVHTEADAVGGHAEVNALNQAIAEEKAALGRAMTAEEVAATFEMHNVWLTGKRLFGTAPRCEHCSPISRGVKVSYSLFIKEGGVVSGEINVPQRGKVVKAGGKIVEAETISGKIPAAKPPPIGAPAPKPTPGKALPARVTGPLAAPLGKVSTLPSLATPLATLLFALLGAWYLEWVKTTEQKANFERMTKALELKVNEHLNSPITKRHIKILTTMHPGAKLYAYITIRVEKYQTLLAGPFGPFFYLQSFKGVTTEELAPSPEQIRYEPMYVLGNVMERTDIRFAVPLTML